MSIFSKLFGGGGRAAETANEPDPIEHQGYLIFAEPIKEGTQFRIAARIEKEIAGEKKVHHLIRADTLGNYDEAVSASENKAKVMIDQMGDMIFRD